MWKANREAARKLASWIAILPKHEDEGSDLFLTSTAVCAVGGENVQTCMGRAPKRICLEMRKKV